MMETMMEWSAATVAVTMVTNAYIKARMIDSIFWFSIWPMLAITFYFTFTSLVRFLDKHSKVELHDLDRDEE